MKIKSVKAISRVLERIFSTISHDIYPLDRIFAMVLITSFHLIEYPRAFLFSRRDTNRVATIDFIRKYPTNVYITMKLAD